MKTENTVSDSARLDAQELGGRLYRNNRGVDRSASRPVRYGLGNESKETNKINKSSDLIGIMPVTITPDHIGMTLGVFLAVEVKKEGWKYSPNNDRSVAQGTFINEINKRGGCGFFLNDTGLLVPYIQNKLLIKNP